MLAYGGMTNTSIVSTKRVYRRRRNKAKQVKKNLFAYLAGILIGGIIPTITWDVAHHQTQQCPLLWMAVSGGLIYSAPMVAVWFSRYVGQINGW